ncbi:hypothetical protein ScPMuIL_004212 [Solemya velum]
MADANTVVEGRVKYRDGKKWKLRWCVIKKPSPVADRLQVLLFKDVRDVIRGGHPKSNFPLEGFYGLEAGLNFDKESIVLAIICQKVVTLLAFESREYLIQFEIKIRRSLGEEHQFPVRIAKVPLHSKLPLELVHLHIHGQKFALTSYVPPKILMSWQISDLRRFGMVDSHFCFEGGSRCGKGAGLHALASEQVEEIADVVRMASLGKTPSCKKQSVKRRSQLSEYLEPMKSTDDHRFNDFHGASVGANQNFVEDSFWPKRHSVSLMNYISTGRSPDKKRLSSIENLDKEHLMAIYDIPPRRIRRVENLPENQTQQGGFCNDSENSSLNNFPYPNWSLTDLNMVQPRLSFFSAENISTATENVMPYSEGFKSCDSGAFSIESAPASLGTRLTQGKTSSVPLLYGSTKPPGAGQRKVLSNSEPVKIDCEALKATDKKLRQEALDSLKQQEIDLQREMSLLEEMLQSCQREESKSNSECKISLKPHHYQRRWFVSVTNRDSHSGTIVSKQSAPLPYVNLSKYDLGDVSENHVNISELTLLSQKSSTWDGCERQSHVMSSVSLSDNKENTFLCSELPESLRRRSGSESLIANLKRTLIREPIYANERRRKSDTPPPELPPKGPALVLKNRQRQLTVPSYAHHPPPLPPDRRKSYGSHPRLEYSGYQYPNHNNDLQDAYLMMAMYDRDNVRRCKDSKPKRERTWSSVPLQMAGSGSGGGYMDMTGMFIPEPSITQPIDEAGNEVTKMQNVSVKSINQNTSSVVCTRDTNYMLMSDIPGSNKASPDIASHKCLEEGEVKSLPSNEADVRTEDKVSIVDEDIQPSTVSLPVNPVYSGTGPLKAIVPFPKLINFKNQSEISSKSSQGGTMNKASKDKQSNSSGSNKNANFFTRLMRRNSKDRKSISQSQENLISSSSSDKSKEETTDKSKEESESMASVNSSDSSMSSTCNTVCDVISLLPPDPVISSATFILNNSKLIKSNCSKNEDGEELVKKELDDISVPQKNKHSVTVIEGRTTKQEMNNVDEHRDNTNGEVEESVNADTGEDCIVTESSVQTEESANCVLNTSEKEVDDVFVEEMCIQTSLDCAHVPVKASQFVEKFVLDTSMQTEDRDGVSDTCIQTKDEKSGPAQKDVILDTCIQTEDEKNGPMQKDGISDTCIQTEDEKNGPDTDRVNEVGLAKNISPGKLTHPETGIFSVLHMSASSQTDCHKTDDEKLIELYQLNNLPGVFKCADDAATDSLKKLLTPDEQAAAIARHVTSLPPFVPPKMKTAAQQMPTGQTNTDSIKHEQLSSNPEESTVPVVKMRDPASKKKHAKATLRITPPSEDENGNIWIPRAQTPDYCNAVMECYKAEEVTESDAEPKFSTLVVEVGECDTQLDNISISSTSSSTLSEETVRSSPASTILRPRSGKNYQMVERRRLVTDSPDSSPSPGITPNSPSNGSFFTFDLSTSPSKLSVMSKEAESPCPHPPVRLSSLPGYVKSMEAIGSPKLMYMNVDMTPPPSPLVLSSLPVSERMERQLNYAEIDLSLPPRKQIGRVKKPVKKTTSKKKVIAYAMIDMVATAAAQKAGKEHAQSRADSLSRQHSQLSVAQSQGETTRKLTTVSVPHDRKSSVSSSTTKERKYSSNFEDRKQSTCSSDRKHSTCSEGRKDSTSSAD